MQDVDFKQRRYCSCHLVLIVTDQAPRGTMRSPAPSFASHKTYSSVSGGTGRTKQLRNHPSPVGHLCLDPFQAPKTPTSLSANTTSPFKTHPTRSSTQLPSPFPSFIQPLKQSSFSLYTFSVSHYTSIIAAPRRWYISVATVQ